MFGQAAAKYVYDEAGRLKSVTYLDGTQALYSLDAAGNRVNVTTGANTTPPSVPTGLTGTSTSSTQVNLTWSTPSDSGFLAGYKIFRNGSILGIVVGSPPTVPATSYSDLSTTCNVTYSYTVEAYDTANPPNVSGPSAAFSVTPPITIPPSVPTGLTKRSGERHASGVELERLERSMRLSGRRIQHLSKRRTDRHECNRRVYGYHRIRSLELHLHGSRV